MSHERTDVGFRAQGDVTLRGWLYLPDGFGSRGREPAPPCHARPGLAPRRGRGAPGPLSEYGIP